MDSVLGRWEGIKTLKKGREVIENVGGVFQKTIVASSQGCVSLTLSLLHESQRFLKDGVVRTTLRLCIGIDFLIYLLIKQGSRMIFRYVLDRKEEQRSPNYA